MRIMCLITYMFHLACLDIYHTDPALLKEMLEDKDVSQLTVPIKIAGCAAMSKNL